MISERKKQLAYQNFYSNMYFWRNRNQAEIDYVEEQNGKFSAFEMKWNPKNANFKVPKAFREAYQPMRTQIIHRDNYWEWLDETGDFE